MLQARSGARILALVEEGSPSVGVQQQRHVSSSANLNLASRRCWGPLARLPACAALSPPHSGCGTLRFVLCRWAYRDLLSLFSCAQSPSSDQPGLTHGGALLHRLTLCSPSDCGGTDVAVYIRLADCRQLADLWRTFKSMTFSHDNFDTLIYMYMCMWNTCFLFWKLWLYRDKKLFFELWVSEMTFTLIGLKGTFLSYRNFQKNNMCMVKYLFFKFEIMTIGIRNCFSIYGLVKWLFYWLD